MAKRSSSRGRDEVFHRQSFNHARACAPMNDVIAEVKAAKTASVALSAIGTDVKDSALEAMANALDSHREEILEANAVDMRNGQALVDSGAISRSMYKRLAIDGSKIDGMIAGIRDVMRLRDPVGEVMSALDLDDGLTLYQIRCPIGMLGVIFESRPDVVPQIMSLCLKSGNAVAFKGGREATESIRTLFSILRDAAASAGIPKEAFVLMESREDINSILGLHDYIDLLIPRGSNEFVRYIQSNTKIPVLGHAAGICHLYVDPSADLDMACDVVLDSKTQYPAVCNALETLLVDASVAGAFLPRMAELFASKGVEVRGDDRTRAIIDAVPATEEDWFAEYLDLILAVKMVGSVEEAVAHINHYGSRHSDGIISSIQADIDYFFANVDSATLYSNASTRFTDGGEFGMGAEIGISTDKLHARGPMGADELTSYKYLVRGDGQIRS